MNPTFWHGKKVLITGHTGFKGAWLSALLSSWGAKVSGAALPAEAISLFEILNLNEKMASHLGDIRHPAFVDRVFDTEKPEIVFHLAAQALVRPSYHDPIGTYATNVMGTAHILEAVRMSPQIKSVVIVSSDKCYENREWVRGYKESDAMGGWDPYSSSKGCTELLTSSWVHSFFHQTPIGIASGRAGNVIGGGDFAQDRIIPDCMRAFGKSEKVFLRNPKATRPWQHVLEPLSGYLVLAEKNFLDPYGFREGWNFGPGYEQELTVEQVVKAASKCWGAGASSAIQDGSHPHEAQLLRLDCSKAIEKLGWKTRLNFEQTIQWTVDWYKTYLLEPAKVGALTTEQLHSYTQMTQQKTKET